MRNQKTIAIVSCSKRKKTTAIPIPAEELYNSTLFRKALACAKSLKPDAIYILSAKYNLVELTDKLPYYDMFLSKQPATYRRQWAETILKQLEERGVDLKKDNIVFLTGKDYYINLVGKIGHYEIIGEGLRQGKKMQEFARITEKNIRND